MSIKLHNTKDNTLKLFTPNEIKILVYRLLQTWQYTGTAVQVPPLHTPWTAGRVLCLGSWCTISRCQFRRGEQILGALG